MKKDDIYNLIIKSFHEGINSHAFLLSTNNVHDCLEDVIKITKAINCKNDGLDDCKCNICSTIDAKTNPDVIIVSENGKEIKQDKILNIVNTFMTKPLICKYQVYIICNADKMNDSSANKILKFLEEPEENIIGFFITDKINKIIPTIKSRCEVFNYQIGNNSILNILNIDEEEYGRVFDISLNITKKLNTEPKYELMSFTSEISKYDRADLDLIFNLIRKFYEIKYENVMFNKYSELDYINNILEAIETKNLNKLVKRIKLLDNIINNLIYNVNKDLVINKFFIMWE